MKKILFITTSFYPLNSISTIRVGQWVKYLSRNGYEITVLTTKKYPFMEQLGLNKEIPKNVNVIEIDFLPKIIKKRFDKKVNKKNWQSDNKSSDTKVYYIKIFVRKLRKYIGSFFDIHDLWTNKAYKYAQNLFGKDNYDFIISSFSPPAVHIISHKLKNKYPKVKWIADFRDLWAYNHVISAKGPFKVLEKFREKKVLSNVDKIITVSNPLTDIMKKAYRNKEIYTIENGFDPEEFSNWKEKIIPFSKITNKITISYLGTIYPQKMDPSILFEAVNELIEESVIKRDQIKIAFYGDNKKQLEDIITPKNYNKYDIIHIKGFVSREESLNIQKKSDLLLFLEWNDPSARGVLTGKLFEYLVSGTPILSVGVSNKNSAREIIEKTKTGKLFLEKNHLKNEFISILNRKTVNFYNPVIKEIEKYSRDKQVKKLIEIME